MASQPFRFKKFSIEQEGAAHRVGTDGVLLGAWTDVEDCTCVLDIGTGTGVVALMLAQRAEKARIYGVEMHLASADLARRNFAASPWPDRLTLWKGSAQDFAAQTPERFDLIVSNPPFFTGAMAPPEADRRLVRHSVSLPPETLLAIATQLLLPSGRLNLILPVTEGRRFSEAAVLKGLYCTLETVVYARPNKMPERLLLRLEKNPCLFTRREMSIYAYAKGNEYSAAYKTLVQDFYLSGGNSGA
jgi:tRNA1Val (adenine37-N6)-methyltransferase